METAVEERWDTRVRHYLARRDPALLTAAIDAAPQPEIRALLQAFAQRDIAEIDRMSGSLVPALQTADRLPEAITTALLPTDLRVRLVEAYNQFPLEQQMQALQIGLQACEEALNLCAHLEDLPCIAIYRNVMAGGLYQMRELEAAREAYQEGLTLYRRLAQSQPAVYLSDVATTLNNLGNVLSDLRELEAAREAYREAIRLRERLSLALDCAETYSNLGFLEAGESQRDLARQHFEACVSRCEQGMGQLTEREREHRDLYKGKLESAYRWLIEDYARNAAHNGQSTRARLVGLMEALRQIETVAGFEETTAARDAPWQNAFQTLRDGTGPLAAHFREQACAFLWIHATANSVVFVTLISGDCRVDITERSFYDRFRDLWRVVEREFADFSRLVEAWEQAEAPLKAHKLPPVAALHLQKLARDAEQRVKDWMRLERTAVAEAGEAAFRLLPERVQSLLTDAAVRTLFLAPCAATIVLPFELLRAPGESACLGQRKLLPRLHGLAELTRVLDRQPDLRPGRQALVVGNPTEDLKPTETIATNLAALLETPQVRPPFDVGLALGKNATRDTLLHALKAERLTLWSYNGHGDRPDSRDGAEYLVLANGARLYPQDVARLRLPGTFVHHDCCMTGATRGRGGGRFDGHPTAALLAGASCVLSSVHPLLVGPAADLSALLYDRMLAPDDPLPVGEALLQTRQALAQEYGNSLLWATTVLWGNPWARLAGQV